MNILAISPTYNEKKNIAELINRITLIPTEIDLLIIDDNSPDGTADIVKSYMVENKHRLLSTSISSLHNHLLIKYF